MHFPVLLATVTQFVPPPGVLIPSLSGDKVAPSYLVFKPGVPCECRRFSQLALGTPEAFEAFPTLLATIA